MSKFSFKDISEMQKWTLGKKIEVAVQAIQSGLNACHSKAAIAFSGGKDSTVLWHLLKNIFKRRDRQEIRYPKG